MHALPESKRYAETDQETAEILRRANVLGTELFGEGGDCWLVEARFHEWDKGEASWPHVVHAFDAHDKVDDLTWAIFAARVPWHAGAFDALLRKIADDDPDVSGAVFWIGVESGIVFAPYDGGFDMIFPTVEQAVAFRDFRPAWRPGPTYPGGW